MSYNNKTNYLTGNKLSDEWYTPKFLVDKCIDILDCKNSKKHILLPFDSEKSLFVEQLQKTPNEITFGIREFIDADNYDCDIILTNPPFSIKEKVFEKCLKYKKDFALIMPETFVFSVGFYNLLEKYNFKYKLYVPKQRVYFIGEDGKQNRPNFHTIIIYVSNKLNENTVEHFYSETK